MNQHERLFYVSLTNNIHRNPGMLARGSHPIHDSADLKLLTNIVLRNQNQNMSHIKSHFLV